MCTYVMGGDVVECGVMESGAVGCGVMGSDAREYDVMESGTVECDVMQSDAGECHVIQSDTVERDVMGRDVVKYDVMENDVNLTRGTMGLVQGVQAGCEMGYHQRVGDGPNRNVRQEVT